MVPGMLMVLRGVVRIILIRICFLKQAKHNKIRRLNKEEAVQKILTQTFHSFNGVETMDKVLQLVESLVNSIPIYELENRPEPDAAWLSYRTMCCAEEEI